MLRTLHIRDFVIVDQAEIAFEPGFTVFSGETGAGKSILIDALSLALGARTDPGVVRENRPRADISAIFDAPDALRGWLRERELDADDDTLILRRVIDTQARSRAFVNGLPVTQAQLRELAEHLVDIHGQHAHQSLLKSSSQRSLLDDQGGHQALAAEVRQAWQAWQQADKALQAATQNAGQIQQERERLAWQAAELDHLDPRKGEWEHISNDHNRLAHAQALQEGASQALAALDNDESSAQQCLGAAEHHLKALVRHDSHLQGILDTIASARIAAADAVSDLNGYLDRLELDPDSLARAEQRVSALFDAARKFRVEPEELPALRQSLHEQLQATQQAYDIPALTERANTARGVYGAAATRLSEARRKAGKALAKQVTKAMQTLAMQGGSFDVSLIPGEPGAHGNESVEFLVAAHEGVTPRPLVKVASGGELARLSLALSVIASQAARVPTLIFDEVDAGVGGAVAEVVGRLLKELGERHQVLCVTHLPQVAARGTHHYEVRKSTTDGSTFSVIQALDQQGRVDELARMLGGLTITDTTRRHAREMLAQ
jgi:DNA repair protein RecN (Recombination protein N)